MNSFRVLYSASELFFVRACHEKVEHFVVSRITLACFFFSETGRTSSKQVTRMTVEFRRKNRIIERTKNLDIFKGYRWRDVASKSSFIEILRKSSLFSVPCISLFQNILQLFVLGLLSFQIDSNTFKVTL